MTDAHPTLPSLDAELPPCCELISSDKRAFDLAWLKAYDILYARGMSFTKNKMGSQTDREDVVILAIGQFQKRLLSRGCPDEKKVEDFFNQVLSPGDD
ncbi:MAG: hypothetical protein JNJ83_06890 [Verrucomicrobiaceae bacterium]|nr:hypothetical protein [Verrucomicrobiaceae bacterium]